MRPDSTFRLPFPSRRCCGEGAGPDYSTHPKTWMMRSAQRPPGAGTKWS